MASSEKVTVDKSYFNALLRRADFHTSTGVHGLAEAANVSISTAEYDSLLRTSRDFELLKNALFQGGITSETLDLLISGTSGLETQRTDSVTPNTWADDFGANYATHDRANVASQYHEVSWRQNGAGFNLAPGSERFRNEQWDVQATAGGRLKVPGFSRQISFGATPSDVPDEAAFDDADSVGDEGTYGKTTQHAQAPQDQRTLYFTGFSERTTFRDLLSVIKGGKLLSLNLRPERSATVTFLDNNAACSFLAYAKRHDIYLHHKRIEVKWADRQYRLNNHIYNKIMNGATRNILIHDAVSRGLTESQIREDMEHIHNLVIIDVVFRNGNAYIATNAVHNALFARTCMMSRTTYKGCKIEFFRDECDTPLPAATTRSKTVSHPVKTQPPIANRFGLLKIDDSEDGSDEENRLPLDEASDDEDETLDLNRGNVGVSLNFLDGEDE